MAPLIASLAEKQPYRFPDSLQLSQDHWINTKPRGELPDLPPLGIHPEEPEVRPDDGRLASLIKNMRRSDSDE